MEKPTTKSTQLSAERLDSCLSTHPATIIQFFLNKLTLPNGIDSKCYCLFYIIGLERMFEDTLDLEKVNLRLLRQTCQAPILHIKRHVEATGEEDVSCNLDTTKEKLTLLTYLALKVFQYRHDFKTLYILAKVIGSEFEIDYRVCESTRKSMKDISLAEIESMRDLVRSEFIAFDIFDVF